MKIVLYTIDSRLNVSPKYGGQGVFLKYSDGGDSACPPRPSLRRAIMLYYLFRSNRIMGAASAGGRKALFAEAPKSVKRVFSRISPQHIFYSPIRCTGIPIGNGGNHRT